MSVRNFVKETLKQTSLFRDEGKLSIDYIPSDLPHREEIIRNLARLFRGLIEDPGCASKKVIITGSTGTGKTAVTKRFGFMIQEVAEENNIFFHYIHINCRRFKTSFMVINRIIQHFNPKFPKRGFNVEELLHILSDEILAKQNAFILLCLDDADQIFLAEPSLLYQLTRIGDDSLNSKQRLSLITIVKNDLFKNSLDPSSISSFQPVKIHLEKYSSIQIKDILEMRVKEAFFDGTVLSETINLISDFSEESGDARYALELLWLAGKYADESKTFQISPEFARKAKSNLDPGVKKEIIRDLGLHPKLLLLAVARRLKNTEKAYLTMGDCQASYRIVCEEYGIKQRSYTKIWEHINELADISDFLTTRVAGLQDKPGQTTIIRLNVPIEILEQAIEKEVENDLKNFKRVEYGIIK